MFAIQPFYYDTKLLDISKKFQILDVIFYITSYKLLLFNKYRPSICAHTRA